MPEYFNDTEIQSLIQEPKPLPADYMQHLKIKPKRGHKEAEFDITGVNGSEFRLILRESELNPLDFSVILAYRIPNSSRIVRLQRYNGKSHEHTNPLENEIFYGFHIHRSTERYQRSGHREDAYAQQTDRYANLDQAINCLIEDCAFELPPNLQMKLFDSME